MLITPDGGFVYVTNFSDASVSVIDATAATQTEVSRIGVGANPFGIVIAKLGAPPITSFQVTQMAINAQNIHQQAQFTLSVGLDLVHQPLTLTLAPSRSPFRQATSDRQAATCTMCSMAPSMG